jgi:hypothetical protein
MKNDVMARRVHDIHLYYSMKTKPKVSPALAGMLNRAIVSQNHPQTGYDRPACIVAGEHHRAAIARNY